MEELAEHGVECAWELLTRSLKGWVESKPEPYEDASNQEKRTWALGFKGYEEKLRVIGSAIYTNTNTGPNLPPQVSEAIVLANSLLAEDRTEVNANDDKGEFSKHHARSLSTPTSLPHRMIEDSISNTSPERTTAPPTLADTYSSTVIPSKRPPSPIPLPLPRRNASGTTTFINFHASADGIQVLSQTKTKPIVQPESPPLSKRIKIQNGKGKATDPRRANGRKSAVIPVHDIKSLQREIRFNRLPLYSEKCSFCELAKVDCRMNPGSKKCLQCAVQNQQCVHPQPSSAERERNIERSKWPVARSELDSLLASTDGPIRNPNHFSAVKSQSSTLDSGQKSQPVLSSGPASTLPVEPDNDLEDDIDVSDFLVDDERVEEELSMEEEQDQDNTAAKPTPDMKHRTPSHSLLSPSQPSLSTAPSRSSPTPTSLGTRMYIGLPLSYMKTRKQSASRQVTEEVAELPVPTPLPLPRRTKPPSSLSTGPGTPSMPPSSTQAATNSSSPSLPPPSQPLARTQPELQPTPASPSNTILDTLRAEVQSVQRQQESTHALLQQSLQLIMKLSEDMREKDRRIDELLNTHIKCCQSSLEVPTTQGHTIQPQRRMHSAPIPIPIHGQVNNLEDRIGFGEEEKLHQNLRKLLQNEVGGRIEGLENEMRKVIDGVDTLLNAAGSEVYVVKKLSSAYQG
ncbi:hypothetical protein ABKN59_006840 [Abortiporus biennis]